MDEYINREAARPDAFCSGVSCLECPFLTSPLYGGCRIDDFIASLPAADVVERKHGKWIGIPRKTVSKRNRTIHSMVYICPLCRYSNGRRKSNFCPNCGADMRGGEDG